MELPNNIFFFWAGGCLLVAVPRLGGRYRGTWFHRRKSKAMIVQTERRSQSPPGRHLHRQVMGEDRGLVHSEPHSET